MQPRFNYKTTGVQLLQKYEIATDSLLSNIDAIVSALHCTRNMKLLYCNRAFFSFIYPTWVHANHWSQWKIGVFCL